MRHTLPQTLLTPLVSAALNEDLGRRGDITSEAVIAPQQTVQLHLVAREAGVVCGMDLARLSFALLDEHSVFTPACADGDAMVAGSVLAKVSGNARAILAAERTALNFLTHLSGVATITQRIQRSIDHTQARLSCTRKTLPGLRVLQKYAVRVGGGRNHRMGLDDAILIKDNHIALAGGDIATAIVRAQAYAGHLIPIEVEVDTLAQLQQVLSQQVALVLLDNMTNDELRRAVAMCRGHCQTEASGGVRPETVVAIAETGVDFVAMGYVTHSAPYVDIGLDYVL